jgi:N-carbamoylputrescine amidase
VPAVRQKLHLSPCAEFRSQLSPWVYVEPVFDGAQWKETLDLHDRMVDRLKELSCPFVIASRPVEVDGRRMNEAFVWLQEKGFRTVRRKWYLPDASVYRETSWFDQRDRNFATVEVGPVRVGFQLCSEMMFVEHAREVGNVGDRLELLCGFSQPAFV